MSMSLARWAMRVRYLVPSTDPDDPRFEPVRYWRGPVWAVVNWMISDGLAQAGFWVLLIAFRPASSASSGAASAIATTAIRIPRPTIPGVWRRYSCHAPATARRRRCQAIRRAEGAAIAFTPT